MTEWIHIDRSHPHISILSLNRPDKRNALNIDLMKSLCDTIERVEMDNRQRALIIRGEGPVFCAGLDLKEGLDAKMAEKSGALVERMLRTVYHSPLITIAAVHGAAVAGGAGLMSVCDFAIAVEGTQLGYPEVRRGLVAGLVMTFLKRQCRERDVRELLLLGELIDAQRGLEIGLLSRVVPEDELLDTALGFARSACQGAPHALGTTKKLLDQVFGKTAGEDLSLAHSYHASMRGTAEAKEGMAAFVEKRPPAWI